MTRVPGAAMVLFAHVDKVSAGRKPDFPLVFNVLRVCSHGSDQEKAGHSRRWSLREDLSAHCVQQRPVSRGLCSHSVRELRRRHWSWQQTGTTAFILFTFSWHASYCVRILFLYVSFKVLYPWGACWFYNNSFFMLVNFFFFLRKTQCPSQPIIYNNSSY